MVNVHTDGENITIHVTPTSQSATVQTSGTSTVGAIAGSSTRYYEQLAKEHMEQAEEYKNQAGASATSAAESASNASNSATDASNSATDASNSAINASTSEANAATSENNAEVWAEGTDEEVEELGGTHSAKEWATYIVNNAPETTVTQTETGATITTKDLTHGEVSVEILNGVTPVANVVKEDDTATITITDAEGTTTANITDGVSVTGVTLISTVGLDKTYRMSFSNGTYFDYVVSNGAAGATEWGGISGTLSNQTDLQNALNDKQDVLTAGTGIDITNNVISNTQTSAEWGNIEGNISDQTDLKNALDSKQDELTSANAGENITITENLLDMSSGNIKLGYYIDNTGTELTATNNFYNTKHIPVTGGKTYTLGVSSPIAYTTVMEYDIDKTFIKRTLFGTGSSHKISSATITLDLNTAFVLIGSNVKGTQSTLTLEEVLAINWKFELGNTATAYTSYGVLVISALHDNTKQDVTDNNLTTTDKTIVGAINEVNAKPSITLYDTTGQNTDGAMTQKAVTDELDNKADITDLASKVSKAGDTMSGDLTIEKDTMPSFIVKNTSFDYTTTTTPSATITLGETRFNDKNGKRTGTFSNYQDTSNRVCTQMYARRSINGTEKTWSFVVGVDSAGKAYYNRPQLITTYVSGASGYNIWSNGYCEQWGRVTLNGGISSSNKKVTFSKTFSDTPMVIVAQDANVGLPVYAGFQNKTYFTIGTIGQASTGHCYWLAKGYLESNQY